MIDSVAGVVMSPSPRPISTIWGTIVLAYDASTPIVDTQTKDEPRDAIPAVTTTFVPTLGARLAPTIEATAMDSATGRMRTPVCSAV